MNNTRTIDGIGRITITRELMNKLHLRADDQIAVSLQNNSCRCLKTVSLWLAARAVLWTAQTALLS